MIDAIRSISNPAISVMAVRPSTVVVAEGPEQVSPPHGKPGDQSKHVKISILVGQSNMLSFGRVGPADAKGTLEYLIQKNGKYRHLIDDAGRWTERNDVRYVHVMHSSDKMDVMRNEWLTLKGSLGPELRFGYIIGQNYDE